MEIPISLEVSFITFEGYFLSSLTIAVEAPIWPKYEEDNQLIVFNANVTGVAFVEDDIYRAEGIQYMIDNMVSQFGR